MGKAMPYTINYDETGYIKLVYMGEANLTDVDEVLARGVSIALEQNCFLVLSDFRAMKLNLSLVSLFTIPVNQISQSQKMKVPFYKFRRALVVPERDFQKYKFFENVAVNRAHDVKVFTDIESVMSWLLEK